MKKVIFVVLLISMFSFLAQGGIMDNNIITKKEAIKITKQHIVNFDYLKKNLIFIFP